MLVRRSELSCRDSIHLDSCVTGAKAVSASVNSISAAGGNSGGFERTNRSRAGDAAIPWIIGFHSVAGESGASIATLRGPVRRSRYGASELRHVSAACCRSAGVIVTCISFSASAKVSGDTGGPEPTPVPNVGGAPGAVGVDCEPVGACLRQAAATTNTPSGARIRNWRRVFMAWEPTPGLLPDQAGRELEGTTRQGLWG